MSLPNPLSLTHSHSLVAVVVVVVFVKSPFGMQSSICILWPSTRVELSTTASIWQITHRQGCHGLSFEQQFHFPSFLSLCHLCSSLCSGPFGKTSELISGNDCFNEATMTTIFFFKIHRNGSEQAREREREKETKKPTRSRDGRN